LSLAQGSWRKADATETVQCAAGRLWLHRLCHSKPLSNMQCTGDNCAVPNSVVL
jgi:hypothetical protein